MVSPPPDASKPTSVAGRGAPTAAAAQERAPPPAQTPLAADRADIRPLDLAGALQILVSEVQAELDLLLLAPDSPPGSAPERYLSPESATQALIDKVLGATPEPGEDLERFSVAVLRIDTAWQSGAARALELVSAWREVPSAVIDGTQQSITLARTLLNEEAVNPWLRAEWSGLAPRLERYRRRRRNLKRYLSDPDFRPQDLDTEPKELG